MKLSTTLGAALIGSTTVVVNGAYNLLALRSASPIHFGEINANGGDLWIGKTPSTYTPEGVNVTSNVTETSYVGPSYVNGSISLDVIVPGGQQIYIEPSCGKVQYTTPHSASMPYGAITEGWQLDWLEAYGLLSHEDGIFFCPANNASTIWEMFVDVEGVTLADDCLGADLLASNVTKGAAWEYTG